MFRFSFLGQCMGTGAGVAATSTPAFFNGLDMSECSSFTGGPIFSKDYLNVWQVGLVNSPSITNTRMVTSTINGGILGPELWTGIPTFDGSWALIDLLNWSNNGTDTYKQVTGATTLIDGATYRLSYEIYDYVSGSIKPLYANIQAGVERSANGIYIEESVCSGTGGLLFQSRASGFNGKIRILSFRQVLRYADSKADGSLILSNTSQQVKHALGIELITNNFIAGSSGIISYAQGLLSITNPTGDNYCNASHAINVVQGKTYYITFIRNSNGTGYAGLSTTRVSAIDVLTMGSSSGPQVALYTATETRTIYLQLPNQLENTTGRYTNISVKEVDFNVMHSSGYSKRYISADPNNLFGLGCVPARTNLCTPMKVNPTVTTGLSVASGSAVISIATGMNGLITEAGLQNICTAGALYKVVATTDSVIGIGGSPGTDTVCSGSAYIAVEIGSAALRMAGGNRVFTTDPKLVKIKWNNQSVVASNPLAIFAAAGSTVYFIAFQYEVGTFGSGLIVNTNDATGAATRVGTTVKFPVGGKICQNNIAFRAIARVNAVGQIGVAIFGIYYDASNRVRLLINQTNIQFAVSTLSLASIYVSVSYTHAIDDCIDCICIKTANGAMLAVRVYSNGVWGSWMISSMNNSEAAKGPMSLPSEYTIGSVGSAGYLSGDVKLFDTLLIPDSALVNPLTWVMEQWKL